MKNFYTLFVLLLVGSFTFGQTTIYDADFSTTGGFDHNSSNPPAAGPQTFDGGNYTIGYDSTPSTDGSGNYFKSDGTLLESADFGGAAYFETDPIDISAYTSFDIAAIASTVGGSVFNGTGEEFTWSYIIDSGTPVNGPSITSDGSLNSPSGWTTIPVTGTSLVVRFDFNINGSNDGFEVTQVSVIGNGGTPACSAITAFPFTEGFESGVPPTCWASYRGTNGLGTGSDWTTSGTTNTGTGAAYVQYEDAGGTTEDWLVTPALDLTSISNTELNFYTRKETSGDYGSVYTVRVSTTSQTDINSFTTVETYTEPDLSDTTYGKKTVDLSAYDGQTVYVAFVLTQDFGDSWFIDDVEIVAAVIPMDFDSKAANAASQPAAATISSLADTSGEAVDVFNIDLIDLATTDALDTKVTKIRILPGTTNDAVWTDVIQGVTVNDGSPVTVSSVTIDDAFIDINFTSGDLTVTNNSTKTITIGVYLNTSNITDFETLSFKVDADNHGFEADATGSTFVSTFTGGDFSSNDFTTSVVATTLAYIQQPQETYINYVQFPNVEIAYVDANGNIDEDIDSSPYQIALTTDGSFDPSSTTTVTAINGVATFDNLIFDAYGTGIKLTATDQSSTIAGTFDSDPFDVVDVPVGTTDLMFTEYVEGSGNNKYIEIYNGTDATVNLSDYTVELYSNGNSSPNNTEDFSDPSYPTTLAEGVSIVLANSTADKFDGTAYLSPVCNFNGDDALVLKKNGVIIDIFGNIGSDPGSEWTDGGGHTEDVTLVRNNDVCTGITTNPPGGTFPTLSTEWTEYPVDNVTNLGFHTALCGYHQFYTYNGTSWFPSDPNGVSAASEYIVVTAGNAHINTNTSINSVTVYPGATLTIDSGVTLMVVEQLTLESLSDNYSNLILDGTIVNSNDVNTARQVLYERFVNSNANGNDLITPPLSGLEWVDFLNLATNSTNLLNNGLTSPTTYAFAPFDKSSTGAYVNFTDVTSATLNSGTGYRVATDFDSGIATGGNLDFIGFPGSADVAINIISAGTNHTNWNLIGNPYPSYISIQSLLEHEVATGVTNIDILENASGIYGYDGDASDGWNVITLANDDGELMAPGQGFFVAAEPTYISTYDFEFTTSMRTDGFGDDFIAQRNANPLTFITLKANTATKNYKTELYFNANSSKGLDAGYDAKVWGGNAPAFALYSHLVTENTGIPMALQSLNSNDLEDVIVPIGVNANQGEQLTFSMNDYNLPGGTDVFLEDNLANTSTLLNSGDYIVTPNADLNGTGRFYLRVTNGTLSTTENNLDHINIYANTNNKTVVIAGQLLEVTTAKIYDIQGRMVTTTLLQNTRSSSQSIDVSSLNAGVYVVQLVNGTQNKTQKVIIR